MYRKGSEVGKWPARSKMQQEPAPVHRSCRKYTGVRIWWAPHTRPSSQAFTGVTAGSHPELAFVFYHSQEYPCLARVLQLRGGHPPTAREKGQKSGVLVTGEQSGQ